MATIWCKILDVFFVSIKEKTLKTFSLHTENAMKIDTDSKASGFLCHTIDSQTLEKS
jgi:hypothetical protein